MHLNKQRGEKRLWGIRDTRIFLQRNKLIKSTGYMFSMGSEKRALAIFINALKAKADV